LRNPGKQQYYDPIVQDYAEEDQLQMRAIGVQEPGTYILFEDIVDVIRSFALSVDDSRKRQGLLELIMWLETGSMGLQEPDVVKEDDLRASNVSKPVRKFRTKEDPDRIELYPDASRKWHARLVDLEGNVIGPVNDGSFDRNWVEKDAAEKYPELIIHQMESEQDDSTWDHKGPSKRLWDK
jgi:hypothetical protein